MSQTLRWAGILLEYRVGFGWWVYLKLIMRCLWAGAIVTLSAQPVVQGVCLLLLFFTYGSMTQYFHPFQCKYNHRLDMLLSVYLFVCALLNTMVASSSDPKDREMYYNALSWMHGAFASLFVMIMCPLVFFSLKRFRALIQHPHVIPKGYELDRKLYYTGDIFESNTELHVALVDCSKLEDPKWEGYFRLRNYVLTGLFIPLNKADIPSSAGEGSKVSSLENEQSSHDQSSVSPAKLSLTEFALQNDQVISMQDETNAIILQDMDAKALPVVDPPSVASFSDSEDDSDEPERPKLLSRAVNVSPLSTPRRKTGWSALPLDSPRSSPHTGSSFAMPW
jgi:uncharacterized membrane protein